MTPAPQVLRIPAAPGLDPITVYVDDVGPGAGRATIACYNEAWTCYWGAMGARTVVQFIADCDEHYVSGNMLCGRRRVHDAERDYAARIARAVIEAAKAHVSQPAPLAGDDRVLWGIVANAGRLAKVPRPRWAHVSDATGLGSMSSATLCRRFGFDPDELRGGGA